MKLKLTATPLALALGFSGAAALAQTSQLPEVEEVTVTASKMRSLDVASGTGSRLGLSLRETPATIDVVDEDLIVGRGLQSVQRAVESLPGIVTGGSPGGPAAISMRGFSDSQIMVLFDGLYVGPSSFVNRPGNSFTLERIEVLKGPASMLHGQGAIGGVVNTVTKKPSFTESESNFLASAGGFGTTNVGVGTGFTLTDRIAVRADIGRVATDGYVHNTPSDAVTGATSLLFNVSPSFELLVRFDFLNDNPSPYWGTPLVPAEFAERPVKGAIDGSTGLAIDERMRYINYNVADYEITSKQIWPKLSAKWAVSDAVELNFDAFYYDAERRWANAETYRFNTTTGLIDRDRFFITHDQTLSSGQLSAKFRSKIGGMNNLFVLGTHYNHLSFQRVRGFPQGDSVDPFNPSPGLFGPRVALRTPTYWDNYAVFFEDVLDLTEDLKLITGGRYDNLDLDRQNYRADGTFNSDTSFTRVFESVTGRIGLVYNLTPNLTPYISYTMGQDPVGSSIFIVNANQNFDLSDSYQIEVGVKGDTTDQRVDYTLAAYYIERKNILTQTDQDTVATAGSQKSQGVEATVNFKLTDHWTVSTNASYTDASYGVFRFSATDDASGNQFPNVPKWLGNVWTSVKDIAGTSLELGVGVRYVGSRFADASNTLRLKSYPLATVYASYPVLSNVLLRARLNNVTDQNYVQWGDPFYSSQVMLGQPRQFELEVVGKL